MAGMPIACAQLTNAAASVHTLPLAVFHCVQSVPEPRPGRVSASHGAYCSALAELVCSQLDASQDDNARTRLINGPSSRAAGGSICLRDSNLGNPRFPIP